MAEIKWEDVTNYGKHELAAPADVRHPRVTVLELDGFSLRIHREFKLPWMLSCKAFGIKKLRLKSEKLEHAQEEAVHTFREKFMLKTLGEVDRAIEALKYAQEESSA
jgi:hypothetical protein